MYVLMDHGTVLDVDLHHGEERCQPRVVRMVQGCGAIRGSWHNCTQCKAATCSVPYVMRLINARILSRQLDLLHRS